MGLLPITPSRSSRPWMITRCATRVFGSKPPRVTTRINPSSSIWLTRNPSSSMCAASITRGPPPPLRTPTTLPIGSTLMSSTCGVISAITSSRMRSSRPGAPGVSHKRVRRGRSMARSYAEAIRRSAIRSPDTSRVTRKAANRIGRALRSAPSGSGPSPSPRRRA